MEGEDDMKCCCPFCFIGPLRPSQLVTIIVIWDILCALGWWIYNVIVLYQYSWAPMVINFVLVFVQNIVLLDVRKGLFRFKLAQIYLLFRLICAVLFLCGAVAFFILIFVFWANPVLEVSGGVGMWWSFWFCVIFIPESVIIWGSSWTMFKAIKSLKVFVYGDGSEEEVEFGNGFAGDGGRTVSNAFKV